MIGIKKDLDYRQDIQGLRGLAVLAITIFHINWKWLPGGFLGVDVFFVISGFLIFRIIQSEIDRGSFSLIQFYTNRIKRIFPALFVVCAVCALLTFIYSLPSETVVFGKSLIATLAYVSNIYFYLETNYFYTGPGTSPLLHTWSLAVEEQYYIFLPLLLLAINKKFPSKLLSIAVVSLILLTAISFALSELSSTFAFYSLPSRGFQFIAGAVTALTVPIIPPSKKLATTLLFAGLTGLAACAVSLNGYFYSTFTSASLATLCAVLIIFSGGSAHNVSKYLLTNPALLYLGKISYSMYLWHWPIITFYTTAFNPTPNTAERITLLIASIVAGHFSWQFIEQPFRHQNNSASPRKTLILATTCTILFSSVGGLYVIMNGLPDRLTPEQQYIDSYVGYANADHHFGGCFTSSSGSFQDDIDPDTCIQIDENKKNYLLLGDSHAAHFYSALKSQLSSTSVSHVTASGCRPLIPTTGDKKCVQLIKHALDDTIKSHTFDKIIISGLWGKEDHLKLIDTVHYLSQYSPEIIVLGPIITYRQSLPKLIIRASGKPDPELWIAKSNFHQERGELDKKFSETLTFSNAIYISLIEELCNDSTCKTTSNNGSPMQFDHGHLTHDGAIDIINNLINKDIL